jgi:hypothetical protein
MKNLILFAVLLPTLAQAEYQFFCVGNRGQVALSAHTYKGEFFLRYSNAMGRDDFPFYEGTVSKFAMPYIREAEKELSVIDQEAVVKWPAEKCEISKENPLMFQCNGEGTFTSENHSHLKSFTFSSAMVTETNMTNSYEIFKIRWSIDTVNFHHSLAFPFDPKSCSARNN